MIAATTLKEGIRLQHEMLTGLLGELMINLAQRCAVVIDERQQLEKLLVDILPALPYCKHLYVLDSEGVQLTDNITQLGPDAAHFGRDRISRPYMQGIIGVTDFKLSEAYISRNKKRPSITAIQVIRGKDQARLGYLGADYDLRELPHTEKIYKETEDWRQIKGDPAIRSAVFLQQRSESLMDLHLDQVLPMMAELMMEHGIFHGKFHFSSSRATIWLVEDPFTYRILSIDELMDPNIVLAYPRHAYHERSVVPQEQIIQIFEVFRELRFADENIYLRAGSLNVINGMVGLNFSCDGSH
ncbi:MAG: PDC sensor domain-containing protein, partial [Gammaproteobacteria bacterium]|nr:PDC sensor domain-containing protein [Gammaproteobacteria bacterium]